MTQSSMNVPLATMLCVLLFLLITLCSAKDNSSKLRDKYCCFSELLLDSFGRNWKQCVFKNLNDGRDSGLIKECVFKKTADNTGLRVFWSGDFRISGCHDCCRRWYFTFNGAECSAPAAIEGILYMINGGKKNPHRVRQIEGVCEKIHKGTVRVGFWVGGCAGKKSGNAYTGWNSVSRIYVEEIPPPQA